MRKFIGILIGLGVAYTGSVYMKNTDKFEILKDIKPISAPVDFAKTKIIGLKPNGYINCRVTKVVDGDTINISYNNKSYSVRLLDVDTPESKKSGVPVQVFAEEAQISAQNVLYNQEVKLYFEKDLYDKYGRILAHVVTKNDLYYNAFIVKEGYARVEIVVPNEKYREYFYNLQKDSIKRKAGFWALAQDKIPFIKGKNGNYFPRYFIKDGG